MKDGLNAISVQPSARRALVIVSVWLFDQRVVGAVMVIVMVIAALSFLYELL